ncbi:MAG TPA: DUF3095 domain-containing protein [Propylenella sp.]|nr:DUF3095 domain-containing protein [Propylenella sp.]
MAASFRYEELPVFDAFERVSDPAVYTPLPDEWHVGVADVVKSTDALHAGRYKAVNMAGASVVAAVKNALGTLSFPFVFGGDGAVLAVPPDLATPVRQAMAATARFVEENLQLGLRVGTLPVAAIRAAGHDVRVARYAASNEAIYAMFSGGGANYAEGELKAGRIGIPAASPGARPDLTGLSCRFAPFEARHGLILSVVVMPASATEPDGFRRVADTVIQIVQAEDRGGHPVPPEGPEFSVHPSYFRYEAAATRRFPGHYALTMARVTAEQIIGSILSRTGRKLGPLDIRHYRTWVTRNSDFRKFDDALRMTVDCSAATADRLESYLAEAEAQGIVDYGLHRQGRALITCLVPSVLEDDHLHFLDGAGGGYALAAQALKDKIAARRTETGRAA